MRLVLFQPDIPQNLGGAIRLCACLGIPLEIIEPCAFPLSDRGLRRAALEYGRGEEIRRHAGLDAFLGEVRSAAGRLILFTTAAEAPHWGFAFRPDDVLLFGSESRGAPPEAHAAAHARLRIPIRPETRSLNLVSAAALALGEALRPA